MKYRYIFGLLALAGITVWMAVVNYPEPNLRVISCAVGQGDATLVIHGNYQVLVDGGPNSRVIDCLDRNLPFWDREIEMVVLTHPEYDHYRGLIDVFERYQVDYFLANSLESGSSEYQALEKVVGGSGVRVINPTTGWGARLGAIQLDVVWPEGDFLVSNTEGLAMGNVLGTSTTKKDSNDFSIVLKLSLNEFDILLTGDIGPDVIDEIVKGGNIEKVEYIKVPHHGSKNGLTQNLLEISKPEVAVISVGKNQWGHPHKEILNLLEKYEISVFRTDKGGDVVIESDGVNWWKE